MEKGINIEKITKELKNIKNNEILFLFESNFEVSKYIRICIKELLSNIGISPIWKNRFILIVDELSNNLVEHGSKEGEINKVRFKYKNMGNDILLNIEFEDTGNGKSPKSSEDMNNMKEAKEREDHISHKGIRGRGLFHIVNKIVDSLYFKDSKEGGLIVGISKKLIKE